MATDFTAELPYRPNILMIGAAGRNIGKTEFACCLIRSVAGVTPVFGVKVTTVHEREGRCPRGGAGCGVCSSLEGDFCITEETVAGTDKDTRRMLAAGAAKVFWLRVVQDRLAEGMASLLSRLPASAAVVMESNSARRVLVPGLFLVVREAGNCVTKPSCRTVLSEADRIIEFAGGRWSLQPEDCRFVNGSWAIREPVTAVLLAGGRSRRMGRDKTLLLVDGVPLAQRIIEQLQPHFDEVLVSADDADKFSFLGHRVVPDEKPGCGPLMGLVSCLAVARHELAFAVGCDIPDLNLPFIRQMIRAADDDFDLVLPRTGAGHYEPLYAVYRRSILAPGRAFLAAGGRKLIGLIDRVRVKFVDFPETGWYHNLNTPADVERFNSR